MKVVNFSVEASSPNPGVMDQVFISGGESLPNENQSPSSKPLQEFLFTADNLTVDNSPTVNHDGGHNSECSTVKER